MPPAIQANTTFFLYLFLIAFSLLPHETCIPYTGKWHLGMGDGNVNWNETVKPGAKEIGFDYSCLIAATNDRVPTVYVENGDVVVLFALRTAFG